MNCRNVLHLLSAYMDGELRGVEHRLVHDHLARCPECDAEYQDLLMTKRLLGRMRLQMPREELSELILQRISAEENSLAQPRWPFGLIRFRQLLRESLPNPRMMLTSASLGVAAALILAYTIVPDNDDKPVWIPSASAQTALAPTTPFASYPTGGDAGYNWLHNERASSSSLMDPAFVNRAGYTPVHNMSSYTRPSYEGVDTQRGWYRIH